MSTEDREGLRRARELGVPIEKRLFGKDTWVPVIKGDMFIELCAYRLKPFPTKVAA
jgi:hypothetical protein